MNFSIRLKYNKSIKHSGRRLLIWILKNLILVNFILFSLGSFLAKINLEKPALRLLEGGAILDLGVCNLAEYQLGTIFMYHLNYEVAANYYWKVALFPLSCVRSWAYYNIGVMHANAGYGFLKNNFTFGTLEEWLISLGAFKLSYKHGERAKIASIDSMHHNLQVIQRLVYTHCVNVCHLNCPANVCKEAISSTKQAGVATVDTGNQVSGKKIREIEKRQIKGLKQQQKDANRKRWLDKALKGDYTKGW